MGKLKISFGRKANIDFGFTSVVGIVKTDQYVFFIKWKAGRHKHRWFEGWLIRLSVDQRGDEQHDEHSKKQTQAKAVRLGKG